MKNLTHLFSNLSNHHVQFIGGIIFATLIYFALYQLPRSRPYKNIEVIFIADRLGEPETRTHCVTKNVEELLKQLHIPYFGTISLRNGGAGTAYKKILIDDELFPLAEESCRQLAEETGWVWEYN